MKTLLTTSIIFLIIIIAVIFVWEKIKRKQSKEKNTEKQPSTIKIIIRTLAIIMFVFGFSLTYNMPKHFYGLTWWELGAMAEGNTIKDTDAMMDYLGIESLDNLTEEQITGKLSRAYDSLEVCLFWSCAYWFTCSALLFIPVTNKQISIKENSKHSISQSKLANKEE